jgi:hypothetical protein
LLRTCRRDENEGRGSKEDSGCRPGQTHLGRGSKALEGYQGRPPTVLPGRRGSSAPGLGRGHRSSATRASPCRPLARARSSPGQAGRSVSAGCSLLRETVAAPTGAVSIPSDGEGIGETVLARGRCGCAPCRGLPWRRLVSLRSGSAEAEQRPNGPNVTPQAP